VDPISINPFIETIHEIFDSMLGTNVKVGVAKQSVSGIHPPDIIGVIGLSGSAQGMVALRFPDKSALTIIGQMVGTHFDQVDSAIVDGVGELVNMVAGSAKGRFRGHNMSVSLPTVVRGDICRLSNMADALWIEVPLESILGNFWLIVSLKQSANTPQEAASEGSHR
jgi:chemotaxis protein CheX